MFAFLSSSKLKENLTELHIIVRTTGYFFINIACLPWQAQSRRFAMFFVCFEKGTKEMAENFKAALLSCLDDGELVMYSAYLHSYLVNHWRTEEEVKN